MASATMVEHGFTAYGLDSVPTHTARICCGTMFARSIAFREASMDIVTVSSSREGTDLCVAGWDPFPAAPQVVAMALACTRGRGTYDPYPTTPTSLMVFIDGAFPQGLLGHGSVAQRGRGRCKSLLRLCPGDDRWRSTNGRSS